MKPLFYLKIFAIMFASYIIVNTLSTHVFVANSPRIRRDIGPYLAQQVRNVLLAPVRFVARLFSGPTVEQRLSTVPFKSIAPGVSAKEKDNLSLKVYDDSKVQWQYISFEHNDINYTIRYAPSDGVPDIEMYKRMMKK